MSDRLDDILTEFASAVYPLAAQHRGWNNSDQDKAEQALQSYIDTKIIEAKIDCLKSIKKRATEHCAFKINQYGTELDTEDVRLAVPVKKIDEELATLERKPQP